MPDGKITQQKLRDHFRRLWLVYLAGAVLLCFLNQLVYTVTRPGFSDDETLKIMLLNADLSLDESALLLDVQPLGFRAVETLPLAAAAADPASAMLVTTQLMGGFCDVYIADEAGLQLLMNRGACLPLDDLHQSGFAEIHYTDPETGKDYAAALAMKNGWAVAVASNGTNTQSALAALPCITEEIME